MKRDDAERLHQCLHQIGGLIESYGRETLVDALVELLVEDDYELLVEAISRRVAKG